MPLVVEEEDPDAGAGVGSDSEAAGREEDQAGEKQPKLAKRSSRYVVVCLKGGIFRLHRAGASGCWMGRQRAFREAREFRVHPCLQVVLAQLGWGGRLFGSHGRWGYSPGVSVRADRLSNEQDSMPHESVGFGGDPWYLAPGASTLQTTPTDLV